MPWIYNTKTGDVLHTNEAEWIADQATGLVTSSVTGKEINLGLPDSATGAQATAAAQKYATANKTTTPTTSSAQANTNAENSLIPGFGSVADALSAFYQKVTDGKMWRSLGWILLGVILIFVGLALLVGKEVLGVAKKLPIIPV